MTKKEVLARFKELFPREGFIRHLPLGRTRLDKVARSEAWNNYTDSLCKLGVISLRQYETWTNPF